MSKSVVHYWQVWEDPFVGPQEFACGATTNNPAPWTLDFKPPVTCKKCLKTTQYLDDLYLYEIGCDGNFKLFEETLNQNRKKRE